LVFPELLAMTAPIGKVRVRWSQLSFAFWDNDRKMPNITLTKSWKDDKGEWHNQNISVTRRDLVELSHQISEVIAQYDETASKMTSKEEPASSQEAVKYTSSPEFVD
jgi:hypothetical protein